MANWLTDWGYGVEVSEVRQGRYNVLAKSGRRPGPTLLLNGHLDTVGVGAMKNPFSADVRDGRLYGRGSCDMKAGVACILATAARLSQQDLTGELIVALTADEEHASLGMQAVVDAGIRADAAVVCEPTSLEIMPAHKGFLWMDVHVTGKAAHGSRPDVGVDAIVHMGHVLAALDEEARRLGRQFNHPLLGPASVHAGTITGGTAPSIYPDSCHLVVERRTLPGETADQIMAEMDSVIRAAAVHAEGLDATVEPGLFRAGTEVEPASDLVAALAAACDRANTTTTITGMSAWVDACFLNQSGTPALCFGPGSIAQAHSVDEWVPTAEIETCERILTDFARAFLSETST